GLFDESSFAKFEVQGPGALELLQRLCANDVDRPSGSITYTQMLNRRGGIECDFTVTRLGGQRFRIVTGTAFGGHDMGWVAKHLPDDGSVVVNDVTSAHACFGLWGPRTRDLLQSLTKTDLGNEAFRYMTAQEISVGYVPCLAARVTYVGELGWELYCPSEYGQALWDLLWEAGAAHGLAACGYRAIDALRIEKGYRVWGADITPDDNPFEAGLGFAVKLDKAGGFVGREALLATREQGVERRLCCLALADPRSVCLGSEPVRVGDQVVGRVTSGGYGYAVERSLAYAYLPLASAGVGSAVEVEAFGEWVAAEVVADPVWDPAGERIRA
ncbi:MAG: aminomethyltransferase family protein, partial [Gaiellales bacterium]